MKPWMFQCREVAQLVSRSMDTKLTWRARMGIRFHLMMCRLCSRHKRQLELIRQLMEHYAELLQEGEPVASLSGESKDRMKQSLQEQSL